MTIKLPSSADYNLEVDLAYPINSSRTDFKVNTANVSEPVFVFHLLIFGIIVD